ncbi:uncharacterized protein CMU_022220 [Cryptosporidium muris RN66]|uniref:Uncharacterized protein n=1 Tax=Cryptosporidium muris (strain RN66) TaxID=441375 RepID=B6AK49_CRYMR|nr:uncharacterized protein CMU_022220 [Cryptosporidium muris RN66]EEA08590.1 hypothetical protein CMU_022220 [Cryptosporidium muris RN66]|eukprot:XP_002142939.1 hypothetical protein [Cryptosporidium muris RN66]
MGHKDMVYAELSFGGNHNENYKPVSESDIIYSLPMIVEGSVVTASQSEDCSDEDLRLIKKKISDLENLYKYTSELSNKCDNGDCNSEDCKGCSYAQSYKSQLLVELKVLSHKLNKDLEYCNRKRRNLSK